MQGCWKLTLYYLVVLKKFYFNRDILSLCDDSVVDIP